ncbi:hypothetical protein LaLC_51500 [Bacillus anthracis]|uniref:Uncharacterized protein n=1 Tax=Bacillus anthracis TaxID=1392 RepID=Q6F044_BACAN|nr:hypothetical protein BX_B0043 [Bacillus anthracis str. A2012]AAT28973.2 hypothetical protein GBAA_pXO2_0043 [Bacillus anthracis str. 'Ames Ancestor']ACP11980.1 hypothetical protein BAMEG_B0045 [Bacillus anthracis str. CDC 684]ACQ45898.1 hypothetical protein BAA_B0046 [Bacillus anthracis str. A0248]AFH87112.1 Hypothetical Protein H9401_5727 [Bacillus anthracis str. H9401]AHK41870.1 hypothetical protein BAPAT_pXO20048 [Bacillus anthracis str. SVA11]EDR16272.1 hypothetical protein BAC_B0124 [
MISLEPYLYESLEQIALELITEGLDYIYTEDLPVQHFIEFKLTSSYCKPL